MKNNCLTQVNTVISVHTMLNVGCWTRGPTVEIFDPGWFLWPFFLFTLHFQPRSTRVQPGTWDKLALV